MTPSIFLLGAPKCGTTSLAGFLDAHPGVHMPAAKEPTYYATDLPGYRMVTTPAAYRALYADAPPGLPIVDASVWHLYSDEAVPNILAACPDPRFVVLARDPVQLVHSLHAHFVQNLNEDEPDFGRAWHLQADRAAGRHLPPTVKVASALQYGEVGKLGAQVGRLLSRVERDRVLLLRFDELVAPDGDALLRVQRFLGLEVDPALRLPHANAAKTNRSRVLARLLYRPPRVVRVPLDAAKRALGVQGTGLGALLNRVNRRAVKRTFPDGPLKDAVRAHFADDVRLLASLTGWDLSTWLPR